LHLPCDWFGGVAIGGDVRESNIIIGVPAERIDELVRERTKPLEDLSASQKETIVLLKDKLDLNERQIRAALETVGEKDIPPERLAAKLIEIAQKFNDLKSASTAQPGDDAEIEALRQQVQAAIDSGDLVRADSVLAQIGFEHEALPFFLRESLDLTLRSMSDLFIQLTAGIIGEADSVLSRMP
jgi:hypothetical protein